MVLCDLRSRSYIPVCNAYRAQALTAEFLKAALYYFADSCYIHNCATRIFCC